VRGARFGDGVSRHGSALALAIVALTGVLASAKLYAVEDSKSSVVITIQDAVARVGEKAAIVARITVGDGLEITDSYRHRIMKLSAPDGVELERTVVRGAIEDGSLVFTVGVIPRRPGIHTVRGLFRFSYHYGSELDIRAARFEGTVTATE
jgi:hypothetical protein